MTDTFTIPARTAWVRATLRQSRRARFWAIALWRRDLPRKLDPRDPHVRLRQPSRRAGDVFTAGYAGVSVPVVGFGVAQRLSPRATPLIFAMAVGLGILAAAPVLVRPLAVDNPTLTSSP